MTKSTSLFRGYISDILQQVKLAMKEDTFVGLVLEGFPADFYREMEEEYESVIDANAKYINDTLQVSRIHQEISRNIQKILVNKGIFLLTPEELICISNTLNLANFNGIFLILRNPTTISFPYSGNLDFFDIENQTDETSLDEENNDFYNYYSFSQVLFGEKFVQFRIPQSPKIYNISDEVFKGVSRINATREIHDGTVVTYKISEIERLVLDIFKSKVPPSIEILLDDEFERNFKLESCYDVLLRNNIHVEFCRNISEPVSAVRSKALALLSKYWKTNDFRQILFYVEPAISEAKKELSQGLIIEEIIRESEKHLDLNPSSYSRDIFITAPTGAGKSLLFQLPAMYLYNEYKAVTIVISPLKALMVDQVTSLKSKGFDSIVYINSDVSYSEREDILSKIRAGEIGVVYLSPEMLLSYNIEYFIGDQNLAQIVIDEAHLVTTWGRDFRVDYWFLGSYLAKLRKRNPKLQAPIVALTATAVYGGDDDSVFDTVESLSMRNPSIHLGNVRRENIKFDFTKFEWEKNYEESKNNAVLEFVKYCIDNKKKAIVYYPYKSQLRHIQSIMPEIYRKYVGYYSSEIDSAEKNQDAEDFKNGAKRVMLATKAFGMGVDVSDINIVYHFAPTGMLSDYVQEIGRAGRISSNIGIAKLEYSKSDLRYPKMLHGLSTIKHWQLKLVAEKLSKLYEKRRKYNMLVSTEDFSYIFGSNDKSVDQKVKSGLMLLERDLLKRYSFNVLIVRPKDLYTTCFLGIAASHVGKFYSLYSGYCTKVQNEKHTHITERGIDTYFEGDIVMLDLKRLWEDKFSDYSFPEIKYKLYQGTLFEEFVGGIFPKVKITLSIAKSPRDTAEILVNMFNDLEVVLESFNGRFFSADELTDRLKSKWKNIILAKNVSTLITSIYAGSADSASGNKYSSNAFLQQRRSEKGLQYRVISTAIIGISVQVRRDFSEIFNNYRSFERYISLTTGNSYTRMGYILEAFRLGMYEIEGGMNPQLFIRINSPQIINEIASSEHYKNNILSSIESRFDRSIKLMDHFFDTPYETRERWDIIEKYFMGRTPKY